MQKHPATFQCSLCKKRFTRAFNLRGHLRTHTDERPFVCVVCGRAFARKNDLTLHEITHKDEKKFVCRGNLATGQEWGCGRRFTLAKNLRRHYRSNTGETCIKPLLDEEMAARTQQQQQQQQQQQNEEQSRRQAATALMSLPTTEPYGQPPPDQALLNNEPIASDFDKHFVWPLALGVENDDRHLARPRYALDPSGTNKPPGSTAHAGDNGPRVPATAPPTWDEASNAADTVRRYIRLHGRLNVTENGAHGYLELTFRRVGGFALAGPDAVHASGSNYNQFPIFSSSFPS